MAAFLRKTSPGLGYGRCWNSGPFAVVSTPVLASPFSTSPVDHVPLETNQDGFWKSRFDVKKKKTKQRQKNHHNITFTKKVLYVNG